MGNSSSTNVFLTVNDSRTTITAGSTLSGEIRCPDGTVSSDLFSGVTLYFIGREDVEVQYRDSNCGSTSGGRKYTAATRDIIRTIIPLDTSPNSVNADGVYPFEYHIPGHLPSSMHYRDGHGSYCCVRYKIKLHLTRGRDQEVPIEIAAKPPSDVKHPSSPDPMTSRIQMFYCIPQGSITWAGSVADKNVGVGEQLTINLGIKNESLAKLERVTAKLKQTIEWHSSGHDSMDKSVVLARSFNEMESMKPWSKDELKVLKKKRHMDGKLLQTQYRTVYDEVLETVQEGQNSISFPIPAHVCQSYSGRLIQIRHYVSITAKTSSCLTSPKIHIPVQITTPRNTPPPIVTAQVIPSPSAPPMSMDELDVCDTSSFVVGVPVVSDEESSELEYSLTDAEEPVVDESWPEDYVTTSLESEQFYFLGKRKNSL